MTNAIDDIKKHFTDDVLVEALYDIFKFHLTNPQSCSFDDEAQTYYNTLNDEHAIASMSHVYILCRLSMSSIDKLLFLLCMSLVPEFSVYNPRGTILKFNVIR